MGGRGSDDGRIAPDPPKGDKPEKIVGGASCTGDDGSCGSGGSGGSSGSGGVNYVLWLGGGVFDFIAGLIHSLSDAALL